MVKTTVCLDPETALALRQLASSQGRSQAELIREALTLYTHQATRPEPKGIGLYRSGRSDVSERAEELLRKALREKRWPQSPIREPCTPCTIPTTLTTEPRRQ